MTVTDRDIARAQTMGRLAAQEGLPISSCPYERDRRVERARWVLAYARAGGRAGLESTGERVRAFVKRHW